MILASIVPWILRNDYILQKRNARLKTRRTYCKSYHLKMPQSLNNCIFFLLRTLRLLHIFGFSLVMVLSYLQTALLLDLRDIQGRYLQPGLFQHTSLDFGIGRTFLQSGGVHALQRELYTDFFGVDLTLGKCNDTFAMARHLQIDVIIVHFSGSFWGTMRCRLEGKGRKEQMRWSFWGTERSSLYLSNTAIFCIGISCHWRNWENFISIVVIPFLN